MPHWKNNANHAAKAARVGKSALSMASTAHSLAKSASAAKQAAKHASPAVKKASAGIGAVPIAGYALESAVNLYETGNTLASSKKSKLEKAHVAFLTAGGLTFGALALAFPGIAIPLALAGIGFELFFSDTPGTFKMISDIRKAKKTLKQLDGDSDNMKVIAAIEKARNTIYANKKHLVHNAVNVGNTLSLAVPGLILLMIPGMQMVGMGLLIASAVVVLGSLFSSFRADKKIDAREKKYDEQYGDYDSSTSLRTFSKLNQSLGAKHEVNSVEMKVKTSDHHVVDNEVEMKDLSADVPSKTTVANHDAKLFNKSRSAALQSPSEHSVELSDFSSKMTRAI